MDECIAPRAHSLPSASEVVNGAVIPGGSCPLEMPPAERAAGPRESGWPASGAEALSITCLAPFSKPQEWTPLTCGLDSLDVGISVEWGPWWPDVVRQLDTLKEQAAGTKGILTADGRCLVLPSGKPPTYRWHLQYPDFHLFVGRSQLPQRQTPNVLAKISSKMLWHSSPLGAVAQITSELEQLGGRVRAVKPSRCDLCADLVIPGGFTLDFLLSHRVPKQVKHRHHMSGEALETFYHGAHTSPIQLRIYDKRLEIAKGKTKWWFYKIWGVDIETPVWRMEFQLRREILKQSGVNTMDDLQARAGGLWKYLTTEWCSFRLPDDANTSRRTVHPWWKAVQAQADRFGPAFDIQRERSSQLADSAWYVSHCSGCLVGFAARERLPTFSEASAALHVRMEEYFRQHDFAAQYATKSVQLGYPASAGDQVSDPQEQDFAA